MGGLLPIRAGIAQWDVKQDALPRTLAGGEVQGPSRDIRNHFGVHHGDIGVGRPENRVRSPYCCPVMPKTPRTASCSGVSERKRRKPKQYQQEASKNGTSDT